MTKRTKAALTIAAAAALGLGTSSILIGTADAENVPSEPNHSCLNEPADFQTNAAGQTFGKYCLGGTRPDYVAGWTDEGVHGWFLLDQYYPAPSKDGIPAKSAVQPDKNGDIRLPVYAFDGKTVLGMATVAHVSDGEPAK